MAVDYKELKKGGFMRQRQKDCFSMRLKSVGGHFTAAQLATVQQVAEKFGQGYVHLTSRQGIEIPFINVQDIDDVKKALKAGGVEVGVCGPRVRTITACQGAAVCPSGLIDTVKLANEFDKRYGGRELPHKFKFGFTGCHNNCLKAEENDMGIKGGVCPEWKSDACIYCGVCGAVCPEKAIEVEDAKALLQLALPGEIVKTRWIIPAESNQSSAISSHLVWEVDEFHGRLNGLTIAEIELEDENQEFTKADFIGDEVTGNPRYYNSNM